MTNYREILRLRSMGFSNSKISESVPCSRTTVVKVIEAAEQQNIHWPLPSEMTNGKLGELLFPESVQPGLERRMPDYEYIRKELQRNGVNKKLLWTEYLEECRNTGDRPLMYSQFCFYIQQEEQKRRATMHIDRKPGEQVEVDWAGDPAHIVDPDTGEVTDAWIFVGTLSYSQYAYVEAFVNEQQAAWTTAHVHMFQYFGGVPRILVPDNCLTAVNHSGGWYTQELNQVYHELAEHYGTAIIPARVRKPRDKPNAEGSVKGISTWIIAALRNETFFSLAELNRAIREKLEAYNKRDFQKKDFSRDILFRREELPLLNPLPQYPFEIAEIREATVMFNYHVSFENMLYSVPYEYLGKKVTLRITQNTVEIFDGTERIASHRRLYGRKGQYDTITEHMPENHRKYLEWTGDRFRKWAEKIGPSTLKTIEAILSSYPVEQQAYRSCRGLLKLADAYSQSKLEAACEKALSYTAKPSYKSVKNILAVRAGSLEEHPAPEKENEFGLTRGAEYYRGI